MSVHYDMNTAAIGEIQLFASPRRLLNMYRISVTLDVSHKIGSDLTTATILRDIQLSKETLKHVTHSGYT